MHKASKALEKVQDDLRHFGLSLKIFDAYRPQRAVDHFVLWAGDVNDTRMKTGALPVCYGHNRHNCKKSKDKVQHKNHTL